MAHSKCCVPNCSNSNKKEPNRHYHVITSVNPRDHNVKKHRLAQLPSKEEHRKNKLISVRAKKVFLEVVT